MPNKIPETTGPKQSSDKFSSQTTSSPQDEVGVLANGITDGADTDPIIDGSSTLYVPPRHLRCCFYAEAILNLKIVPMVFSPFVSQKMAEFSNYCDGCSTEKPMLYKDASSRMIWEFYTKYLGILAFLALSGAVGTLISKLI